MCFQKKFKNLLRSLTLFRLGKTRFVSLPSAWIELFYTFCIWFNDWIKWIRLNKSDRFPKSKWMHYFTRRKSIFFDKNYPKFEWFMKISTSRFAEMIWFSCFFFAQPKWINQSKSFLTPSSHFWIHTFVSRTFRTTDFNILRLMISWKQSMMCFNLMQWDNFFCSLPLLTTIGCGMRCG